MPPPALYVGLMSGTSMDAVDAVLLAIGRDNATFDVSGHVSRPVPSALRDDLRRLCTPGEDDVRRLGETDVAVGALFAETALELLAQQQLNADDVTAIGSHGQTVRHCPPSSTPAAPFTLQIGDPATIAARTGITTVADFRRKDMALGGEAAPLAPAFHRAVFGAPARNRAVINLGGIANITWLPAGCDSNAVIGFDTGPASCLMDEWIDRHLGRAFDTDGAWARSGHPDKQLLASMLEEPYLAIDPPKSTGRELFNQRWLDRHLQSLSTIPRPEDVQATLCEFTAMTISGGLDAITGTGAIDDVFVCGGGAFNRHLIARLKACVSPAPVTSTATAGVHPQHVEAAAFAWLAHRTLHRQPGNIPGVTGASREAVLGGIYYP